jgi:hypothetical protein
MNSRIKKARSLGPYINTEDSHCPLCIELAARDVLTRNHILWKIKLSLKIKFFIWYVIKGVTFTKFDL